MPIRSKAFLVAVKTLDEKWKAGELPYDRKPLNEHIIETMQSKTYWYDYTRKYFSKVGEYPEMVAWLENDEGVPTDLEVWGVEKKSYSFGDLDTYLKNGVGGGKQSHKKGKGKKKAADGDKGTGNKKGKGKEKQGEKKEDKKSNRSEK